MMMANGHANDDALMQSAAKLSSGVAGSKQAKKFNEIEETKEIRFFVLPHLGHLILGLPIHTIHTLPMFITSLSAAVPLP
jgi:hypothetical protein